MNKEELKEITHAKVTRKIKKGEVIFDEGEKLNGVFCVKNGVSKLSKLSPNGKDQIVKLAAKGEVLGHRSVIAEEHTNLSATAVNDMEVCYIPKENIINSIRNNPGFAVEMLKRLAHDLKDADDVIVNMSQKNVKQRIAETFLYIKSNFGEDEEGFLLLTLSRENIANIVGTATESAIRIISEFKKEGWIRTSGKKIGIIDEKKLSTLSSGI
ncbi:MAG: Crp/Fnr family transcriptional regulator [Flavobacteriaceae bacterium]|nr:MAG: Crp/Fnr family transcriptional regulator [Flavobacteriaceae bacterium]